MAGESPKKKTETAGAPAWMATFADMMTLLLCFFVLILSFADINQRKFKQVTATLSAAFGVQRKDPFHEIPTFNSIVKNQYAAQDTSMVDMDHPKMVLDMEIPQVREILDEAEKQAQAQQSQQFEENHRAITESLQREIKDGILEIDSDGKNVIIRVPEEVSFHSGSDQISREFQALLSKISESLEKTQGHLEISGHTDNVPIATTRFRNNWDLSAARASTMASSLLEKSSLRPERITILGHADTLPRVPNTTKENRAKNRRVEIRIRPIERIPASSEEAAIQPTSPNEAFNIEEVLKSTHQ